MIALTCVLWSLYVLIEKTREEVKAERLRLLIHFFVISSENMNLTFVLDWSFWTKLIVVAIGFTGGLVSQSYS
jgi:hypothetical protein